MNIDAALYLVLVVWCALMSGLLVFFREFDDRLLGRIGLFCIVVACAAIVHDAYQEGLSQFARTTMLFTAGVAILLTRLALSHVKGWHDSDERKRLF